MKTSQDTFPLNATEHYFRIRSECIYFTYFVVKETLLRKKQRFLLPNLNLLIFYLCLSKDSFKGSPVQPLPYISKSERSAFLYYIVNTFSTCRYIYT